MRAHSDPADFPLTPDHERCAPRQIDGVYSKGLIDTIGLRYFSLLVEKKGKRIGVFPDVFLPLEKPIDLLCGYEHDACIASGEFVVSGLKLSQLLLAVWSPGAADKHKRQRPTAVIGKAHDPAIGIREFKVRGGIADFQSCGRSSKHCRSRYNFGRNHSYESQP